MPPKSQAKAIIEETPEIAEEPSSEEDTNEGPFTSSAPPKPLIKKTADDRRNERNAAARERYRARKIAEAELRRAAANGAVLEPVRPGRKSAQIELNSALGHFLWREQDKRKKIKGRLGQLESDMAQLAAVMEKAFRARSPSPKKETPATPATPPPEPLRSSRNNSPFERKTDGYNSDDSLPSARSRRRCLQPL